MGGEWNSTTLDKIVNIRTGKLDSNRATNNGLYPFFTCAPDPLNIDEFAYDEDAILLAGNNANGVFHVNRYKGKFNAYQRTYIITAKDDKKVSLDFIYYTLKTLGSAFESLSLGTATKFLTMKVLAPFEVNLPLLGTQKAIAHILGTLDDKIELNRRMNATLEAMARALFKSWFVDFDPVIDNALAAGNPIPEPLQARAKARKALGDQRKPLPAAIQKQFPIRFVFTEEMGWVPEGWEVVPVSLLADLNPEVWTPKNHPDILHYIDLTNAKNGRINERVTYYFSEAPSRARRVLQKDDSIIGTVRPGNRSFAFIQENGLTGSTGFAVMRPKAEHFRSYVYLTLTRDEVIEMFAHLADGGAYPAIRPEIVASQVVVLPCDGLLKKLDASVYPWLSSIGQHESTNEILAKTRDTLLPKLISGQLRIPDAEQLLAEVA